MTLGGTLVHTRSPRKLHPASFSAAHSLRFRATLQPLSGKLYMHFNNKVRTTDDFVYRICLILSQAVFLLFVLLFEIGSLVCGTANSSVMFIAGRAIAGLGASGISNGAMTIISGAVPREKAPSTFAGHKPFFNFR